MSNKARNNFVRIFSWSKLSYLCVFVFYRFFYSYRWWRFFEDRHCAQVYFCTSLLYNNQRRNTCYRGCAPPHNFHVHNISECNRKCPPSHRDRSLLRPVFHLQLCGR